MKVTLINPPNENYSVTQQILINRGIQPQDIKQYINSTDEVINPPEALGDSYLYTAARMLIKAIQSNKKILIIIDSDCDGFTSSAILINYLYFTFPAFVSNNISWFIHNGKEHGLSDCIDYALTFDMVILPDAGSNDYEEHQKLRDKDIDVLILDHHEAEKISTFACVINNQLSDYPNKEFSGAGVTWQFCRYIDKLLGKDYADKLIDLVALGNCGDMMSMTSLETKHLIHKGFKPENISNPFIFEMWQKNKFKLGEHITPIGAAFYIVPFVNAICRSGTQEEKDLIFRSMLTHEAFIEIPSTKRGHGFGEMERVVDQALRTCTNVKNRQTRAQDAGLELLEQMIADRGLLDHKVLLFLLEPRQVQPEIRGLVANKFMAKYQRPCCILTKVTEDVVEVLGDAKVKAVFTKTSYQGSARGYDKSGITNFKDICENSPGVLYAVGHQGAFGLGIDADKVDEFLQATDEALKDMSSEPSYYVDYILTPEDDMKDIILTIADMQHFWGKDFDEALVCIKGIRVKKDMISVMKSNTLKIVLPNGVSIIKFGATDEEIESLSSEGYVEIDVVCRCNANEWNGNISPQLMLEAYEIVDACLWDF